MDHLTSTSVSGNFSLNEPDYELLHQNIIGNSDSVSAAVVNNLNQHNEGKEIEQIVSSHYPGIPNLANFSESMTNSNTMRSSLEERIALQPRGLNRDIEQASTMLKVNRSAGTSSAGEIARTAHFIRKIITQVTIQLAATSHDSLEEPKDKKVKSLIEDNQLIRDMLKQPYDNQAMLITLQDALQRAQNFIGGGEMIGEGSLFSHLPTDALGSAIDDHNDWDQHVDLPTPSSRRSLDSQRSNNTSGDENELIRSLRSDNLQQLL